MEEWFQKECYRLTQITSSIYSFSYSNENSDLAADLVKILSECQQEVPDYLANGGGGGGGMAAQGKILIFKKLVKSHGAVV